MSQVSYGTITITDTNDIESIVIEYNKNQSNQNPPSEGDSNWSTNRPTWQQGYYIWQRARIHKSGTATTADIIGTPVCVTGSTGEQGQPGTAGRSLTGVETKYCIYGTGTPSDSYSGWQDTIPEYNSSTPNYWVKVTNTYSSAPTTEVVKYKDTGITNAMAKAADAQSKAATAETNAANALSLSQATQQHFWFNAEDIGSGANVIKSGAYITDTSIDSFKQNKSGGYLLARSDGLIFGKDTRIDAILNNNGLITSSGGIIAGNAGTNGYIYLSTHDYPLKDSSDSSHLVSGLTINGHTPTAQGTDGKLTSDPAWRQVIGTKFGVDSEGNLYANGANITGHISAESLTIASNAAIDPRIDNESVQVGGSNLLVSKDFIRNQKLTLVENTGELIQEARQGYIISGPMEVQPSLPVIIQFWVNLEDAAETADLEVWFSGLCFYDSEDTYITGYSPETVTTYYEMRKVVAPSNASYCCFSFSVNVENIYWSNVWNNGNNGHNIKVELGSTPTTFALSQEDILNRIPTQVSELTNDENYASFNNFFDKVPHIDEDGVSDGQTLVTFESDNDILPISEVKVDINYTQEGSGDPSSSNIRPISGINHVTVYLSQGLSIDDISTHSYDIDFILPVERDGETVYELTTVYGGVLNVTAGILEVSYLLIESYNGEELPRLGGSGELPPVWVSDRDVYDPNGIPSIGAQVIYQIPTSIEYKVQAQQILMLIGTNNLWSSCDNISVSTITNIAEQDSTYRLVQDMIENFSRSNAAIASQSSEVNNLYNVSLETQKELSDLQTQVAENTRGITRIQDSVEVRVRTPEGEGETSLTVKSVETLEDESFAESSIKITPYQIILRSGENDMVSWLNATSFNTSQMVAADIRPWNMVVDSVTGEVVATGSVAIIGRKNGHVSIKRIQNT